MASPSTVITLGYGTFGSADLLVTCGYGVGTPVVAAGGGRRFAAAGRPDGSFTAAGRSDGSFAATGRKDAAFAAAGDDGRGDD